jgi:two-component system, NarL family, response regulator DesR
MLSSEGFVVAGTAHTGAEALALLRRTRPRLAVIDSALPDMRGLELAKEALALAPSLLTLVYAGAMTRRTAEAALEKGIRAVVLKEALATELLTAIAIVLDGGTYLDVRFPPARGRQA